MVSGDGRVTTQSRRRETDGFVHCNAQTPLTARVGAHSIHILEVWFIYMNKSRWSARLVKADSTMIGGGTVGTANAGLTRRTFLRGVALSGLGAGVTALSGCATSSSESASGGSDTLTLQSSLVDANSRKAMEAIVQGYNQRGDHEAVLNTVAAETFNAQLPTYLTSSNPPDVMVYFAGRITQSYGDKDQLLDVSDIWQAQMQDYPESLRALSTDAKGRQIFIPTNYYWWAVFYRKSKFAEWGVSAPDTWDGLLELCRTLQGKGVHPLTVGAGPQPWPLVGWFDYINLRLHGAQFHRELLAGKHRFDGPEMRDVFAHLGQLVPFFHPGSRSYSYQEAATPLFQGEAGMYLIGALITDVMPDDLQDDIDFFQVPVIDPSVPVAEEAPTNGFIAPAKVRDPEAVKDFLTYLESDAAQKLYVDLSQTSSVGTSPSLGVTDRPPLVQKGLKLINSAQDLTQFFNRDSSEALQQTNYDALGRFVAEPGDVDAILREWQSAAERVFKTS